MSCVRLNIQTRKSKACLELEACPGVLKQTSATAKPCRYISAVSLGGCARRKSKGGGVGEGQTVENSGVHRRERKTTAGPQDIQAVHRENGQESGK